MAEIDYSEGRFPKNRLEALTDGIFAIAMTILVLGIEVPSVHLHNNALSVVESIVPDIYHYTLAFLMLMVFWVIHHRQFAKIDHIDSIILWVSGISLLFIALIPFTTALSTEFHGDHLAPVFLEANLLIVGCIYAFFWYYSVKNGLIKSGVPTELIMVSSQRTLIIPITSVIAIGIALAGSTYSTMAYLAIPFVKMIHTRITLRQSGK
ncbi:DUF1211 domain-containing protein [Methanocalculus taiwanensis]|uniref:DUF1211 domain-containing protein n=1 Tax=Methanocalculus taiwanensis TaxID=106207 RepID=A0ABD4THG2_9EURY|nr:TMEM175 family protein [Methanocalculus taiwanensis]MCQ1538393.1 DUF1211 domain-containing protein [Methanocalculus taiwanensis]